MGQEVCLMQWMLRSGRNVNDPVPISKIVKDMGNMFILRACEDIDTHTPTTKFTR
jgi:hypothetical protein